MLILIITKERGLINMLTNKTIKILQLINCRNTKKKKEKSYQTNTLFTFRSFMFSFDLN